MSRFPELARPIITALVLLASADTSGAGKPRQPQQPQQPRQHYGFGRAATDQEIAAWNIDVRPDGKGLPIGHGSVQEGQALYDEKCAACHGVFGDSGDYLQLAGGVGSLKTQQPLRTVGSLLAHATTLWDYINRAMPFNDSKTLSPNEVYAVTAYVLNLNEILPADAMLDEKSLPLVKMPNSGGFTTNHGMLSLWGKPDVHNTACMKDCVKDLAVSSSVPPAFVKETYGDLSGDFRFGSGPAAVAGNSRSAEAAAPKGSIVAAKNACTTCHGKDKKIVGPAFRDVAAKYKDDESALEKLSAKVRTGGAGSWGPTPMPPQTQLSDADLKAVLNWVLAGAPAE